MEISELQQGQILTNKEVAETFLCSTQGGMRKSNRTDTLVLISNHIESVYSDRWDKNILYYSGTGRTGDQDLSSAPNRTLAESSSNNVSIHLFEVFENNQYTYQGEVSLAGSPFSELQEDAAGNERKVYVFPLKLRYEQQPTLVSENVLNDIVQQQEKIVKSISDEELLRKIKYVPNQPGQRQVNSKTYERNPLISEYTLRRAKGICELCKQDAPFIKTDGTPYLEIHHIEWLANGGEDTIENTVALCPNCHRKMHSLRLESDVKALKSVVK